MVWGGVVTFIGLHAAVQLSHRVGHDWSDLAAAAAGVQLSQHHSKEIFWF